MPSSAAQERSDEISLHELEVVVASRSGWFRRIHSVEIRPGDTIVVPLDTERVRALPLRTQVTQIPYNLSIAILAIHSVQA